ncbi:hypothetical protein PtA15_15A183 [Puccinia triticina]|uniref:sn-1-specific diacylglycerol lipase n=2 Tax=Puccinia triticina TaxID=208348 RepID=A0ABY7D2H2_9BASI|nr:uncharacterized protein PtA15_15A183 [Puccinia triticina]WAQ91791.1 hypothetical protein PtA15_15A183 [Puccinia triticina]
MDDHDCPTMPGYLPIAEERDQAPGQPGSMSKSLDPSFVFAAAHGSLAIASFATRFGFNVAQRSVQLGLAIPQTIVSNVLPSQLKPVSTVIQASLSFAEYSTLTALQLAEGISTGGLDLAAYSITELDSLIKSYQQLQPSLPSLDALRLVVALLRQQWEKITPHSSDLPPGNKTEPFQVFQVLRALSTWALIQQLTQHVEDGQLSSYLIPVRSSPSNRQVPAQIQPGFEEDSDEDPEIVKQKFKRYIDLSLSSYGGLGHILFNSKNPPSSEDSQSSKDTTTYEIWNLLMGKHDHDLLREHGELFEDTFLPGAANEGGQQIAETFKDLLPAVSITTDPLAQEGKENGAGNGKEDEKNKEMTALIEQIGSLGAVHETNDAKEWSLVTNPDDKEMMELEMASQDLLPELENNPSPQDSLPDSTKEETPSKPVTSNCQPPRYFILIDKIHQTVIVCLRGTFSLSDVATDLTCDYENFDPEAFWDSPCWEEETGDACELSTEKKTCGSKKKQTFRVHKGFLEVSKSLIGYPITPSPSMGKTQQPTKFMASIRSALKQQNTDNDGVRTFKKIEFVGHSLGAGVGVMLSLMLADPRTGLSTKRSGLPEGTSIRTYAICPPCTASKGLTELSSKMVKTLIHSNDLVPRLSLNHVLNLKTLIIWIDHFENNPAELPLMSTQTTSDGIWKNLLQVYTRLKVFQSQNGDNHQSDASKKVLLEDEVWLIEMRNLLESKIQKEHHVDVLLPAGKIYWMVKDDLFIVPKNKAQDIFNRIKFDINMVKDHLIHQVKTKFAEHL